MSGSPPSQSSSSTQTNSVPPWAEGYAKNFLDTSQQLYQPGGNLAPYPYPNQQVAPFSGMQNAGFNAIAGMGGSSPLVNQAMDFQSGVMSQDAINNPLLAQYYNAAAQPMVRNFRNAVAPGIATSSLKAGAFGGTGQQQALSDAEQNLGQGLSNLGVGIYEPAWNQQEMLRQTAANMSPALQQAAYFPAQQLLQAGGAVQQQAQNVLNTDYQNQYAAAGWPYQALTGLGQGVNLALGGTGGTTTIQTKTK